MTNNIVWVNRYLATDTPDANTRWEKIGYCNELRIATIKTVTANKTILFSSQTFFPCSADDVPYFSTTHETVKAAQEWVEYMWMKFKLTIR